jgi:excisionase family DNA binding protein
MASSDPSSTPESHGAAITTEVSTVVAALREVAQALRELAEQAPLDAHQLLRAEEVAARLKLPHRTVRDQAAAGVIPHRRFGKHYRFSLDDVEAIVRQMERRPHHSRQSRRAA